MTSLPACGGSGFWQQRADVIVIGTGVAGLAAALAAHRRGSKVVLLSKASEAEGATATFYAQGGIAVDAHALEVDHGRDRRDDHVAQRDAVRARLEDACAARELDTASAQENAPGWEELPAAFVELVRHSLRLQALETKLAAARKVLATSTPELEAARAKWEQEALTRKPPGFSRPPRAVRWISSFSSRSICRSSDSGSASSLRPLIVYEETPPETIASIVACTASSRSLAVITAIGAPDRPFPDLGAPGWC